MKQLFDESQITTALRRLVSVYFEEANIQILPTTINENDTIFEEDDEEEEDDQVGFVDRLSEMAPRDTNIRDGFMRKSVRNTIV